MPGDEPSEAKIFVGLTEIFHQVFARSDLTLHDHTTARDIPGWDSLRMVSILIEAESMFGIDMASADIDDVKSVGDLVRLIQTKLCPATAGG